MSQLHFLPRLVRRDQPSLAFKFLAPVLALAGTIVFNSPSIW